MEFIYSIEGIKARYGERGITHLDTTQYWLAEEEQTGKAVVSDDTQMTLYTANGLLNAIRKDIGLKGCICSAYIEWYLTQVGKRSNRYKDCWIARLPELNKRRAPGNTCLSSLWAIYSGREPINNSKGCGGVMRIAPIPLYAAIDGRMTIEDADGLAAEITHQHPLGTVVCGRTPYFTTVGTVVCGRNPYFTAVRTVFRGRNPHFTAVRTLCIDCKTPGREDLQSSYHI